MNLMKLIQILFHIVLFDKDKPIGTGRCYVDNSDQKCFHIGRITVLKEYRKYHLGNIIMKELENHIKEVGGNTIQLSSQVTAKKFYSKLGYQEEGEEYLDEFCPNVKMIKKFMIYY